MTPQDHPTNPFRDAAARARSQASRLLSHRVVRAGAAGAAVAIAAIIALTAILIKVANEDTRPRARKQIRAVAQIAATKRYCAIEPTIQNNAQRCDVTGPNQVTLTFATSLVGRTAIVSPPACCPGVVAASVVSPTAVLVVFPRLSSRERRASVLVP